MNSPPPEDSPPQPAARTRLAPAAYRRFDTVAEYRVALDEVLGLARRSLWLFDVNFDESFATRPRIELLHGFLRSHPDNRLRIVVHEAQPLARECPRLVGLLRLHGTAVAIHETTGAARSASDPLAIADAMHALRRFHHALPRSSLTTDDPVAVRPLVDRYEQIWESSAPALSATTLGL
jgi:hypothetical protein